jgi:hypothetical protein
VVRKRLGSGLLGFLARLYSEKDFTGDFPPGFISIRHRDALAFHEVGGFRGLLPAQFSPSESPCVAASVMSGAFG